MIGIVAVSNFVGESTEDGSVPVLQSLGSKLCFSPYKTKFCTEKSDLPTTPWRWEITSYLVN